MPPSTTARCTAEQPKYKVDGSVSSAIGPKGWLEKIDSKADHTVTEQKTGEVRTGRVARRCIARYAASNARCAPWPLVD